MKAKRWFSILLCILMIGMLFPVSAFAEEGSCAEGHDYVPEATEPTCTADGFTVFTCSRCGDSYKVDGEAAPGHSFDDGIVTTEPTVDAEGVKTFTCVRCGDSYTETVPKLEAAQPEPMMMTTRAAGVSGIKVRKGETLQELAAGEYAENHGTIVTNNGTVYTYDTGTVTTNNGTVTDNYGTVTNNYGQVVYSYGTISTNKDKDGVKGSVYVNYGTVEINRGTIELNRNLVEENTGSVGTNLGIVFITPAIK